MVRFCKMIGISVHLEKKDNKVVSLMSIFQHEVDLIPCVLGSFVLQQLRNKNSMNLVDSQ